MKNWIIRKLGGFPDFQSALDHVKKMEDISSKNLLLTEAVKHLFNTIGPDDVLKRDPETRLLRFGSRMMTETEEKQLKSDAQLLLSMKIWQVIRMDIKYQLNKKMFEESTITMDIVWGKLLLFYDDIIRSALQRLKKM
jgi:hypothetical protein